MPAEIEEEEFDSGCIFVLRDDLRVDFCALSLNMVRVTML